MTNQTTKKKSNRTHVGDRFIICEFTLTRRAPLVLESNDDLGELLKTLPDHIAGMDRISVCEVVDSVWLRDEHDPTSLEPKEVRTLYKVVNYDD